MAKIEIKNIELKTLPKKKYELSWLQDGRPTSGFFTESRLLSFANNLRAYKELREYVRQKIRTGDY